LILMKTVIRKADFQDKNNGKNNAKNFIPD